MGLYELTQFLLVLTNFLTVLLLESNLVRLQLRDHFLLSRHHHLLATSQLLIPALFRETLIKSLCSFQFSFQFLREFLLLPHHIFQLPNLLPLHVVFIKQILIMELWYLANIMHILHIIHSAF